MEQNQMRRGEKLIFAWGDFFGGGAQALISVLYLVFLTDVIGLEPAIAALAIMISKVWDAVSDPLMGIISDNTRTRFGRRRPYILGGGFLVIIAFALLWLPTGGLWSEMARTVYALATYLLYSTVSTIVAVPYSSLSAELTTNIRERNTVNVIRLVFSTAATAICTLVPSLILEAFKAGSIDLSTFYLLIGVGFGIFFALPLILIGLFTRERVRIPEVKSVFHLATFIKPLRVKAFRGLVYIYLCQSISMDILGAGIVYYSLYVAKGSTTVFLGIFIGVQLLLFPLINHLVNVVDKRKIYYFGLPLALAAFTGVGIYPAGWPTIGAYILTGLTAIGFAGAQLMSWIIFPDAVDAGELRLKERATGSFSGIMTFIRKTASAIAIFIFGSMLTIAGYIKPSEAIPIPQQTPAAILGIRIAMTGSFVILMLVGYFIARSYVLTNQRSLQVRRFLKLQDAEKLEQELAADADLAREYRELEKAIY
ncbi:MAG: MFS transporter [Spirochaetes bacterium]|nr:MFS transporter [Spirochaetota bacterium]MBU0953884.1 MFS transporter [Spirochaetota bacterium]